MVLKNLVMVTTIGMAICASELIPISLYRVANIGNVERLRFAGDTASQGYVSAITAETFIGLTWETWMFVGIATMLFSIGFWLLTIIKNLRFQRSNLGRSLGEIYGMEPPGIEPPLKSTGYVRYFLSAGMLWMLIFFFILTLWRTYSGLAMLNEQLAGNGGSSFFNSNQILTASLGMLVRPGKAIGLALLFTGIGFALMTIVVNLRLT